MTLKHSNIFTWPSKFYPNWDFWFENIPSGNPDCGMTELKGASWLSAFNTILLIRLLTKILLSGACRDQ
jgi:hypothetical protein